MTTFEIISKLKYDWDGEGGLAPDNISLGNAQTFMSLIPNYIILPEAMINANGNCGLFWNEVNLYAELEFLNNNRIAYFIEKNGTSFKGTTLHHNSQISSTLLQLLII